MHHVLVTIGADGAVAGRLGRASRVAVAAVADGEVVDWHEHPVGWDLAHDEGTEGAHHARIVTFLRANTVDVVVTRGAGPGMQRTLDKMGVRLVTDLAGDGRLAAVSAVSAQA